MATQPKTKPKSNPNPNPRTATTIPAEAPALTAEDKDAEDEQTAQAMTNGQCHAIVVQQYLRFVNGGGDLQSLAEVGAEQARAIGGGDLSSLERMLLTQAQATQAMFIDLATRAKLQDRFDAIQTMTTLALKCAAQSRQAITALAELRMPKTVMFAKQANVTSGPQQVNNGVVSQAAPARAEENQKRPNELLEAPHGNHLDTGASGTAGRTDPHLAPLGAVHRAQVTGR